MQRAAASTTPPIDQSRSRTPDSPPFKRQKLSVAPTSTATPPSDLQLVQAALVEEEEKRQRAIERLVEDAGETKWVLSTVNGEERNDSGGLRVAKARNSDIDQEAWRPAVVGRRRFGEVKRDLEASFVIFNFHMLMMMLQIISIADRCIACPEASRWRSRRVFVLQRERFRGQ